MANVNTLLDEHVTLRYECLDRIFLNGSVPKLQTPEGLARFLRGQPGEEIPRYAILGERTAQFNRSIEQFAEVNAIPLVHFERGQRKEALAQPYLDTAQVTGREGVVLIGIAQERASVFRPPAVRDRVPGRYAARRLSAYVNHVYFYVWDHEWGGAFLKVCTYAPWSTRVWLNGHSWAKRQLEGRHIGYQTTASPASTLGGPSRSSATACLAPTSSASSGGGSAACRRPSRRPTPRPATATS